jgi:predicted nucleic acid-binding protein
MKTIFIDSAYAIALAIPKDQWHHKAIAFAKEVGKDGNRFVMTWAVMTEIGDALSKRSYRAKAINMLLQFEGNSDIEVVTLTELLYSKAFSLYQTRLDKDWGLTDCMSFVFMQERGITEALASDEHFSQAGFVPLLAP